MGYKLNGRYSYTGAIHIHTTESDGTKTLEEVVALGQEVGLDFMMFADHMTLSNRNNHKEGFYDKTLVVIGYEHNDLDDNHHYLIFDSPKVYGSDLKAAEYVAAAADDRALGIMAHPDEIAFSPRKSMVGPTERILKNWDELNGERKVAGIASVDAHAFPIKIGPGTVEIFPYKVHFRSLGTYLILDQPLSNDYETARSQLYQAIRECRLFCANVRWGDPKGFEFYAENGTTRGMAGETIELTDQTILKITLPRVRTIKIIGNGRQLAETRSDKMEFAVTEPGVYRVEAWRKKRGWLFSNHIRIGVK